MDEDTRSQSLVEALGREPAVERAVEIFYDRVLADPLVRQYFERVDMDALRRKQVRFMLHALEDGAALCVDDMRLAHAHLRPRLTIDHFTAIVAHFVGALSDMGVPDDLIEVAVARLSPLVDAFTGPRSNQSTGSSEIPSPRDV